MHSYFKLTFILLFLPLVMLAHTLAPRRARPYVLLAASYFFVWQLTGWTIVYLLAATLVSFGVAWATHTLNAKRDLLLKEVKRPERKAIKQAYRRRTKALLVAGILVVLGMLVALNYLPFFCSIVNAALAAAGSTLQLAAPDWRAPIGISFYTLMALSYLIDVFREQIPGTPHLGRIALYLAFFPHIMEGPFARYAQTADAAWAGEPIKLANVYPALLRIAIGFAKKLIVADRLAIYVSSVFDTYDTQGGAVIALGAVVYTIQLYCDFSGCMDVALGLGQLFGVEYPENFRQPLFSQTITEFWQRWHITLGLWFKDYVYYPVSLSAGVKGLTKKARKRLGNVWGPLLITALPLFCVWFCNGLWHGAGSQYLFFGLYYFVFIWLGGFVEKAAQQWTQARGIVRTHGPYKALRVARTLAFVFVGELIFRSDGVADAFELLRRIVTNFNPGFLFTDPFFASFMNRGDFVVGTFFFLLVLAYDLAYERGIDVRANVCKMSTAYRWAIWIVLVMLIVIFGGYGYGYIPIDPMYAQF